MNKNDGNEVYILGKDLCNRQNRRRINRRYLFFAISLFVITLIICVYNSNINQGLKTEPLKEVEILPENASAPKFRENLDFSEFLKWIGENLKYPKGLETEDAKVIVTFTINKKGDIDNIKILSQPQRKEFGQQVVSLLKRCPKWYPGKLANGESADIDYTLPISFTKKKKY
jgi:TonB family protein